MKKSLVVNIKRKVALCMILALGVFNIGSVNASPVITHSGGSASSSVILNVEPYVSTSGNDRYFSVTVPVSFPLWVDSNNTVYAATNVQIVNNSNEAVKVESVKITPQGNFKLVDFDTKFSVFDNNSYKFGMEINNDRFNTETKTLKLTDSSWKCIEENSTLPIIYTARFAPITSQITDYSMAEITFTVSFVN